MPMLWAVINGMLTSTSAVGHSACQGRPIGNERALSHFCVSTLYTLSQALSHCQLSHFIPIFALLHFRVLYQAAFYPLQHPHVRI